MIKHASIIPLIGGITLGAEKIFGQRPEYILSYPLFASNDKHLLEYYNNEVPYHVMEVGDNQTFPQVDVVTTCCPCAGLSSLSINPGSNKEVNDWMLNSAEFVMGEMKPKVFWGENAPRLATKLGAPVVKKLRKIASKNGYVMSLYKTKSILHGLGQVRDRTFYFFWKDSQIPMFEYYDRPYEKIEDMIRSVEYDENDPMSVLTNDKIPSKDDLYYRYILEEIEGGISHSKFQDKISSENRRTGSVMSYLEEKDGGYLKFIEWLKKIGRDDIVEKTMKKHLKLMEGKNIMRRTTEVPSDYIGAFVAHLPQYLTHPDEDRYLTVREAMSVMKLPSNFNLIEPKKNLNHICQNVPVTTAADMAKNVKSYLEGNIEMIKSEFIIQDNKSKKIEDFHQEDLTKFFSLQA